MYVLCNFKNKQKESHHATKPLKKISKRVYWHLTYVCTFYNHLRYTKKSGVGKWIHCAQRPSCQRQYEDIDGLATQHGFRKGSLRHTVFLGETKTTFLHPVTAVYSEYAA
jgi:hypothetical protein